MRTSQKGIDLIKRFEQLELKAYLCPAKVLTIGYGHTGKDVHQGLRITEQRANELLTQDVKRFEDSVNQHVKVTLSQNQFDALVSFAFNVGTGAFEKSTLLKLINKGVRGILIRHQFEQWVHANGAVLQGLVVRRKKEADLYLSE